jgi:hypothetical protein
VMDKSIISIGIETNGENFLNVLPISSVFL